MDKFAGGHAILVYTWDDVVIRSSGLTDKAVNWVAIDQENCLSVEGINGRAADVVRAVSMWPHRNDNEFCEVEVGGCADEFRERS